MKAPQDVIWRWNVQSQQQPVFNLYMLKVVNNTTRLKLAAGVFEMASDKPQTFQVNE